VSSYTQLTCESLEVWTEAPVAQSEVKGTDLSPLVPILLRNVTRSMYACASVATDTHPYTYTPGTATKKIMYPSHLNQLIKRAAESDSSCRTTPTDNIDFSEFSSRHCKPQTDWAVIAFTGLLFMFLMPSLYVKRRMLKDDRKYRDEYTNHGEGARKRRGVRYPVGHVPRPL